MIGAIISLKFIGKKKWSQAIIFWIVYFVLMVLISSVIPEIAGSLIISAAIFLGLAHYWPAYKYPWFEALKIYAVALIIDVILVLLIFGTIVGWATLFV